MDYLIPHFGKTSTLRRTINSVYCADKKASIYIGDDTHSLKLPSLRLKTEFRQQIHIIDGTNTGYASQVNQLMRNTKGDWVVVMNNDVVLDPSWWSSQRKKLQDITISTGLIASKILLPDGSIDSVGDTFSSFGIGYKRLHHMSAGKAATVPITSVSGALMLLRRQTWQELGGFDEQIASYFEDVDFGLRILVRGWEIDINEQAQATHYETSSTKVLDKKKLAIANSFLVIRKNFSGTLRRRLLARLKLWWLFYAVLHPFNLRAVMSCMRQGQTQPIVTNGVLLTSIPKVRLRSIGSELLLLRRNYRFNSRFW